MIAFGGKLFEQAVATAIVCLFNAPGAVAEICDKAGWVPEDGRTTLADVLIGGICFTAIATAILLLGVMKRWHGFTCLVGGFLIVMVWAGFSEDPADPIIRAMIAEGCKHEMDRMALLLSSTIPLVVGAAVVALKFRQKSRRP